MLQRRARCLRWGVRTVWGVRCARSRARGAERRQSRPHTASPMGLRKLHRGRGDSRHFRRHRGFIPEGSLFMSLRAIGYLLTHAACLLSVRQKKENFAEQRQRREVYRTPYWGERKNRSVVKKNITILKEKNMLFICISRKIIVPVMSIVWLLCMLLLFLVFYF